MNIWYATGELAQFSNLAERRFYDRHRRIYWSVEHAYQSWKSGSFDEATYKKYVEGGVKILGRKGTKTQDGWNIRLMERIIRRSFNTHPALKAELVRVTGDVVLTHRQDRGIWRTEFPRILMELRAEYAQALAAK